ncbi:MAG: hypothetical protein NTU89_00320 [Candidatus Dependentiae bacterium]|nr:hypothetical protein [Candidatus Dependentiae bacterium]
MKKIMIPLFLFTIIVTKISFASEQTPNHELPTSNDSIELKTGIFIINATSQKLNPTDLKKQTNPIEVARLIGSIINNNSGLSNCIATSTKGPMFQTLKLTFEKQEQTNTLHDQVTITYKRLTRGLIEAKPNKASIFNELGLISEEALGTKSPMSAALAVSLEILSSTKQETDETIRIKARDIKKISDIMHALKNGSFQWNHTQKFTKIETEDDL